MNAEDVGVFLKIAQRISKGEKGDKGDPGIVTRGHEGPPGASVKGDKGDTGVGIKSIRQNPFTRRATILLTNGEEFSFQLPRDGKNGKSPKPRHGKDGKDGVSVAQTGVIGNQLVVRLSNGHTRAHDLPVIHAKDGKDGTRLLHGFNTPPSSRGNSGDWYLDRVSGAWWEKQGAAWEKIHQPPKSVSGGLSERSVREIIADSAPSVRYTSVDTATTDLDEVIIATAGLTVTLHTPDSIEPLKPKRIKRIGDGNVTVTTVDASGYVLNVKYQSVDVQWTGTEWISL